MAKIGIYVPKYKRDGENERLVKVDDNVFRRETLKICKTFTEITGGCTSVEVTGYFLFKKDDYFSEHPCLEIYSYCDDDVVAEMADRLKPHITDMRLRLGQQTIGMYVNDQYLEI